MPSLLESCIGGCTLPTHNTGLTDPRCMKRPLRRRCPVSPHAVVKHINVVPSDQLDHATACVQMQKWPGLFGTKPNKRLANCFCASPRALIKTSSRAYLSSLQYQATGSRFTLPGAGARDCKDRDSSTECDINGNSPPMPIRSHLQPGSYQRC